MNTLEDYTDEELQQALEDERRGGWGFDKYAPNMRQVQTDMINVLCDEISRRRAVKKED